MPKYINFIETTPNKKTKVWSVCSKGTGECLGVIKWLAGWRKYSFHPYQHTIYEETCLKDIADFIERVTKEHKQKKNKEVKNGKAYTQS